MLICKAIVLAFHQSRESSCHPYFIVTEQHCSKGERGKSHNKAKLAEVFQDFWQALSEFYFENGDLRDNKFMHPRVFDGADFIGDHEKTVFFFIT